MTTEAALLAAIAANPADDLPRLVYADWLDEQGRSVRAAFIRLQIEIAKKETLPRAAVNAFAHLWQRQQEILDEHAEELLGPLADIVSPLNYEFRRGFLERVQMPLRQFLSNCHDYLATLQPTPAVRVTDAADPLDELPGCPNAHLITEMSIARTNLVPGEGFAVVASSELRDAVAGLPRLSELDLEGCGLGNSGITTTFAAGSFPALVDLDLSFNDITDEGVIDLLNTGLPQRLKRLVLGGNPLGDQAAMELADRLGRSTVLEHLNLRLTNIGRAGQLAISNAFGGRADLF